MLNTEIKMYTVCWIWFEDYGNTQMERGFVAKDDQRQIVWGTKVHRGPQCLVDVLIAIINLNTIITGFIKKT